MKIQNLAIIFLLIIMPIAIVFTEYVDNQIETIQTETTYDSRLFNATYDALQAYKLNTINNANSDRPESKVDDIEAAITIFYNSLVTSFRYDGYNASVMDEYIPAVVFTMYDGYYIYQPFINTLTEMSDDDVDDDYEDGSLLNSLKPYVYYNCRYVGRNANNDLYDIVITYTLDNFITIEGTIDDEYIYDSGYLVDGITYNSSNETYTYDSITFSESDTEELKEFVGTEEYSYTKIDGTKFYYDPDEDHIFYINSSGERSVQVENNAYNTILFATYYNAIFNNYDGYIYYKNAYEFTDRVREEYGLTNLTIGDAVSYEFETEEANILIFGTGTSNYQNYIQNSNSEFNNHRAEVIRKVIETNLSTAISSYARYGDGSSYIMPNISETDWDLIANNICIATFMQGMSIGGKVYNSYAVVANNVTKEYVDEEDIYILTSDHTYHKANDTTLSTSNMMTTSELGYYPGVLKLGFERRLYIENNTSIYYYPMSYTSSGTVAPYLGSYTSIIGSSSLDTVSYTDMYRYMHDISDQYLKKTYYLALGRERTQVYNVQNGLKEGDNTFTYRDENGIEITINNWYYLKNYFTVPSLTPGISITFNAVPSTWTNGAVTVTASTGISGYTLETSTNGVTWTSTDTQTFTSNGTMYARLTNGITSGEYATFNVDNIDNDNPTITTDITSSNITSGEFTVNMTIRDNTSGVSRIEWYYKLSRDSSYSVVTDTYTQTNGSVSGTTITTSKSRTISVSESGTYDVYAIVYDVAGNSVQSSTIQVTVINTSSADSSVSFSTSYGTIDVIWLSGTSNTVTSTPNAPILTSNGESMTPVTWTYNSSSRTWTEDSTAKSDWYDYVAVTGRESNGSTTDNLSSRWANAKTANGSYFVWIPRYAYRITYYSSETSTEPTGYYDGWGMWRASDGSLQYGLDSGVETVEYNGNLYIVHPVFCDNVNLGGWDEDLEGFWFSKYEMSGSGSTSGSSNALKSVPNVQSLRSGSIGDQYRYARNANFGYTGRTETMTSGGTSYSYRSYMSSHLIKNSEWGAVVYLAYSQYGRNGNEIDINNSSTYITGNGGGSTSASAASGITNAYNTSTGARASTTGNVYGIYDLSGGGYERIAIFNRSGSSTYLAGESYGLYMTREAQDSSRNYISTKYITVYNNTGSAYGTEIYTVGIVGDATKEVYTKNSYYNWHSEYSYFFYISSPFMDRGGYYNDGSVSGMFYSGSYWSNSLSGSQYAFHVALCP